MRRTGLEGRLDRVEGTRGQREVRDRARRLAEVTVEHVLEIVGVPWEVV